MRNNQNPNHFNVDGNKVSKNLAMRIAHLSEENALLVVRNEALVEEVSVLRQREQELMEEIKMLKEGGEQDAV
ncbi:hypothetical protein ACQCVK_04285 [Rossellomorea vietnamensis]|uniref:hypothetical protein n=1 Tax=Rossellomorea vietnamensis TaxID=218284 RepID=UPI003CEB155F